MNATTASVTPAGGGVVGAGGEAFADPPPSGPSAVAPAPSEVSRRNSLRVMDVHSCIRAFSPRERFGDAVDG